MKEDTTKRVYEAIPAELAMAPDLKLNWGSIESGPQPRLIRGTPIRPSRGCQLKAAQ